MISLDSLVFGRVSATQSSALGMRMRQNGVSCGLMSFVSYIWVEWERMNSYYPPSYCNALSAAEWGACGGFGLVDRCKGQIRPVKSAMLLMQYMRMPSVEAWGS